MANIITRIVLRDGDKVARDLERIGVLGTKAFDDISSGMKRAGLAGRVFAQQGIRIAANFQRLSTVGLSLGQSFRGLGSSLQTVGARFRVLERAALRLTAVVSGAVFGLFKLVDSSSKNAQEIVNTSKALGLSTDELQAFQFAGAKFGLTAQQLNTGLTSIADKAAQFGKATKAASKDVNALIESVGKGGARLSADSGINITRGGDLEKLPEQAKKAQDAISKLGVTLTKANGQFVGTREAVFRIADAFAKLPDGIEKTRIGVQLVEKEFFDDFAPLLNLTREELKGVFEEFDRLGNSLSGDQLAALVKYRFALVNLQETVKNAKDTIGGILARELSEPTRRLTAYINENRQAIKEWAEVQIKRAIPILKDLFNTLSFNDTDVIDRRFIEFRDGVILFAGAVKQAFESIIFPIITGFIAILDRAAAVLNGMFGTDISGAAIGVALAVGQITGAFGLLFAAGRVVVSTLATLVAALGTLGSASAIALVAIIAFWPEISKGARDAFEAVRKFFNGDYDSSALVSEFGRIDEALLKQPEILKRISNAGRDFRNRFIEDLKAIGDAIVNLLKGGLFKLLDLLKQAAKLGSGIGAIGTELFGAPQAQAATNPGLGTVGPGAGNDTEALETANGEAASRIQLLWIRVTDAIEDMFFNLSTRVTTIMQEMIAGLEPIFEGVVTALDGALAGLSGRFTSAAGELVQPFRQAAEDIVTAFTVAFGKIDDAFALLAESIKKTIGNLRAELVRLREAISAAKAAAGGGDGDGFALGGLVRGRGGPRSDNVFARLSPGEFVVQARAVQSLGLRAMNIINRGILPGGFAAGGLVEGLRGSLGMDLPRFATGGFVDGPAIAGTGRPISLTIGNQTVDGLTATPDAVGQLFKMATNSRIRAAGRRPGWER